VILVAINWEPPLNPSVLLRSASVIGFLFAVGHTAGAPWTPRRGLPEQTVTESMKVVESMKSVHFPVMGKERSYWDFYFGFGVSICVYLFALAIILWQVASQAKSEAVKVRPLMLTLLLAYLINAIVTYRFFFAFPLIFAAVICICIGLAWISAGRRAT
jgi:hypothetical protein